jgi:hypothetical protein
VLLPDLLNLIQLVGHDLLADLQIERDEILVLLTNDLFVAGDLVQFVEVADLVSEGLSEQFVVVLRGGDVLRK